MPFFVLLTTGVYWFICVPRCKILGCTANLRLTHCCHIHNNPCQATATTAEEIVEIADDSDTTNARPRQWKSNRDGWIVSNVYFVYVAFPSIVRMQFELFSCQTICGVEYLTKDEQEPCWISGSRHERYAFAVAIPGLLLYVVVLPTVTLLYLWSHRHSLMTDRTIIFRWGLLFSGYNKHRWFWELVVVLRKILLILIVTFARSNASQLHFALGTLVALLYLQERGRPFASNATQEGSVSKLQNDWLHLMEIFSLIVLVTMIWISVFFTFSTCDEGSETECIALSSVLFASNIAFVLVCGYTGCKSFGKKNRLGEQIYKLSKLGKATLDMVASRFRVDPHSAEGEGSIEMVAIGSVGVETNVLYIQKNTDDEIQVRINPLSVLDE